MSMLSARFAGKGWLTLFFTMLSLLTLAYSQASQAQWTNAYFRGTPNNWVATAMTKNSATGQWETQQNFAGTNPRFKVSRYTDNWNEAYPAADFAIASLGDYHISFNETSKAISAVKLAATVSATSVCFSNPNNFATPYMYFWAPTPAGSATNLPAWPGKLMTKIGNYYCYDLASHLVDGVMPTTLSIIFSNNGANQTANLTFTKGAGCYEGTAWKNLQQCGYYLTTPASSSSSVSVSSSSLSSSSSSAAELISANSICFNNPNNFAAPYIYFWNPIPAGTLSPLPAWPGKSMTKRGVFYCYDFSSLIPTGSAMPTSLDVIFSNNGANQTATLKFAGAGCYDNAAWKTLAQCGFSTATPASSSASSSSVAQTSSSVAQTSSSSSLSSLSSSSLSSAAPVKTKIYFKNTANWAALNIHYFNVVPAAAATVWPGPAMVKNTAAPAFYSYEFAGSITSAGIVFSNNGNPKTADLNFVAPNNCYDFGTTSWKTAAACGVPSELVANAGVDRKANVNTRQALSAAASTGDYVTASWTSTAWSGALTGKQVVTPVLPTLGSYSVTLILTDASGNTSSDSMVINVVAASKGLPERPQLAATLGFPITGTVSSGNYRFVDAFPNLVNFFYSPVMVTNDGMNNLVYVVDKEGAIYVFPNNPAVTAAEVRKLLDIKNLVLNNNESGLLSMAFDPNFATNGYIYIYYMYGDLAKPEGQVEDSFYARTDGLVGGKTGDGILERWTLDNPANPTSAGAKVEVLRVPQIGEDHKGGMMQFHPTEKYLYLGIGEGGYGHSAFTQNPLPGDVYQRRTNNSAQDPSTLRGKFIRIEPLATAVNGKYYRVPSDNPFVGQAGYLPEIWSMGHRNPWRWSFDTVAPYTLWETEIGQDTDLAYEEVNLISKGQNYGWPVCEGTRNRGVLGGDAAKNCLTDYVPPREGYGRTSGVSIIGGFVYRGTDLPALNGRFIFGDYVSKRIWSVANDGQAKTLVSESFPHYISAIGRDFNNNLLVSSHGRQLSGPSSIYKMVDDSLATVQIPAKLSSTGLFADLVNVIPAHGVIEYSLNTSGWFDGGKMRHFIAVPNANTVGFDPTALWQLPVGTVLVKHLSVATAGNANQAFTTSVLFRQDSGWQAANYRWNAAGTDADLVTESTVVPDGGLVSVVRKVESGGTCSGCHKDAEGKVAPLATHSRQLNGNFNYQGVIENQLDVLNSIALFSTGIGSGSSYSRFAAPTDSSVSLTERAKSYLDTNCAHCHTGASGSADGMDMRYSTALENMNLVNEHGRVIPGIPANSNVYKYQTGSGMRMPFGSTQTNAEAETLFRNWINELGVDVVQTGVELTLVNSAPEVNQVIGLSLDAVYSNSTKLPASGTVSWVSSNPAIISTEGKSGASINLTALAAGTVTISASSDGYSDSVTLEVAPASNPVTALSIVGAANKKLLAGEQHQLVAVGTTGEGALGMTARVIWSSSNSAVASVSAAGLVTAGTTAGTAIITAGYGDLSTTYSVAGLGAGQYIYVKKPTAWANVSAYVWTNQGGVETARTGVWPGVAVTEVASQYGADWRKLVIPAAWANSTGATMIIFSNNGANQTANLTVNQAQPSWYDTAWLAAEPTASAVEAGTQIQVGNGSATIGASVNLSGKLFVPGTLLDIKANAAGPGMQFVRWEGTGAAYLLDATSATTQMVVGNALSLTLLAVFDAITDEHVLARSQYQTQGCLGCHGADGLTLSSYPLSSAALSGRYTQQSLATYIATYMPKGSPGTCVGSCASSVAAMIMDDALIAPAGVCDANSLDSVIPQDRGFRLLSTLEYNNSVRDLLGLSGTLDLTTGRIPADLSVNGFKTNANAVFTNDYAKGYVLAAEAAAALVSNIYSLTPGCSNATCFVQTFGKRAFRRPLSSAEVTQLVTLHTAQGNLALLTAILSSPSMLYRSEVGVLNGSYYELTDYEVAAMLSYTYWATTPDAALMAAADAGQLSTPEQIATQVRAMLQDPKAQIAFERFITGWLDLDKEIKTTSLSDSLKADMKAETIEFVKRTVFGGGSYNDLLTANYSYMTQQLATHYGLTWPGGSGVQRVDYTGTSAERSGVMGHAGILAIQSASEKTHPVKRGLFVRRNLLCQDFPPPPVGAELKPQEDPSLTVRERFEHAHLKEGCEACHQYIDGIGFGLENYNALGLFVTSETTDNGLIKAINSLGQIGSLNSAETYMSSAEPVVEYQGMDELMDLVAGSSNAKACYARQWYRYSRGQHEEVSDSCTLQVAGSSFKSGANTNLLDLMVQFTQTKNYILRK